MLNIAAEAPSATAPAWSPADITQLNEKYRALTIEQRVEALYQDFTHDDVMLTSSFAATSAFLLHVFHRIAPWQSVLFIDTGYHFPETLNYKKYLTDLFKLDVQDIRADAWKHEFTRNDQTWTKDPDFCCFINKVEPLESIKANHKVWVSGLMRWQTEHRSELNIFEERNGILKFYPLIDVTKEDRDAYIRDHHLPFHPLVNQGYQSIGCVQCTKPGDDRNGRWNNCPKTECGLHL